MASNSAPDRHEALLYAGSDDFAAGVLPFVREGLERHDAVMVVSDAERLALLADGLGADGREVELIAAGEFYMRLGTAFSTIGRALLRRTDDGGRLRLVAELPGAAAVEVIREYLHFESAANLVYGELEARVLCPFDTTRYDEDQLALVRATHQRMRRGARVGTSADYLQPVDFLRARLSADLSPAADVVIEVEPVRDPGDLDAVRRRVRAAGAAAGIGREELDDLLVAVNEVVTNALAHGGGAADLRTWVQDGWLICQVADLGPGLADPSVGYFAPLAGTAGGRGLWLARQLCQLVQVRTGADGTTVRLCCPIPSQ